jgi:hypothetical protein
VLSVCLRILTISFECLNRTFMKLGVSWNLSPSYFLNPSHHSVCICIPPIVAKQRLGKHVPVTTKTRNNRRIVELVIFCEVRVSSKETLWVCPPIVARQQLDKDLPAATKNCWRRRFLCGSCRIKRK